jgi:hypothetical protein
MVCVVYLSAAGSPGSTYPVPFSRTGGYAILLPKDMLMESEGDGWIVGHTRDLPAPDWTPHSSKKKGALSHCTAGQLELLYVSTKKSIEKEVQIRTKNTLDTAQLATLQPVDPNVSLCNRSRS